MSCKKFKRQRSEAVRMKVKLRGSKVLSEKWQGN